MLMIGDIFQNFQLILYRSIALKQIYNFFFESDTLKRIKQPEIPTKRVSGGRAILERLTVLERGGRTLHLIESDPKKF